MIENKDKLKILIAAEIFPPDIGGPSTYAVSIAKMFQEQNFDVKLICYGEAQDIHYDFSVTYIKRRGNIFQRYFRYFWKLYQLAKECDVIFSQGPVSSGLPSIFCKLLLKKKVIVKVVGDYAWEQARNSEITKAGIDEFQSMKIGGKIGILKRIEKFVCRKADRVIVPSVYLKKIVLGWGTHASNIRVIYNSVQEKNVTDSEKFSKQDIILSIGRLVSWKGFDVLIEITADIIKSIPNLRLFILGEGPWKNDLLDLSKRLKIQHAVKIEKVDAHARDQYLQSAKIFVLNTGYEGFSHTILEAMAHGVPVITTHVCGNSEIIQNGYNGILVEYNNKFQLREAIVRLYNNPDERRDFIKNAKDVLTKFTPEIMLQKTMEVFKEV